MSWFLVGEGGHIFDITKVKFSKKNITTLECAVVMF